MAKKAYPLYANVQEVSNGDTTDRDLVLNFLANWIDANIVDAPHEPYSDPSTMQPFPYGCWPLV